MLLTSTERTIKVRLKDNTRLRQQNNTERDNYLKRKLMRGISTEMAKDQVPENVQRLVLSPDQ